MPSWKRVIVSGSDASLNSLTVSNGITGSLLGTASFANNALTASYVNPLQQSVIITGSLQLKSVSTGSIIDTINLLGQNVFQVTNAGRFIVSKSVGDSGQTVNVYANQNGSDGMYFQNDNTGSNAGIQLLMGNDGVQLGQTKYFQIYYGSTNNSIISDGTLIAQYGSGGQRFVSWGHPSTSAASAGPISFAFGGFSPQSEIAWFNHPSYISDFTVKNNINILSGSLKIFNGNIDVTGSIIATNGITGSLLGTASFANRATSASYALNGGVTQLLAGPNITLSPISGLGQVTISSTGTGGPFFNTATGSYGSFYDTTTQTNVAGTARSMSFNTTDITNGVSISGSTNPFNTYIKTENAGVYDIQFSAQVDKTDSGTDEIWIWLRKNGTNLTDTATSVQLVGNGAHYVAAWNFFVNSAANDYYQLMWYSPDANVRLHAESGFGVVPGIPSVIATVNRVDQFLSNTGSFSGSFIGEFTGSLFGTSSWAQNALTASYVNPLQQTVIISGSLVTSGSTNLNLIDGDTWLKSVVARGTDASTSAYPNDAPFLRASMRNDTDVDYGFIQAYSDVPNGTMPSGFQPLKIEGRYIIFSGGTDSTGDSAYFDRTGSFGIGNYAGQWLGNNTLPQSFPAKFNVRLTSGSFNLDLIRAEVTSSLGLNTIFAVRNNGQVIISGSLDVTQGITGSLFGTSSWAQNALTASYITPIGTNAFVQGGNSFGTQALLGTNDNNNLALETNGSVRMFISSSGNVGIGTTDPSFKLDLQDTSTTYVARFRGANSTYIVSGDTSLPGESGLNARNSFGQLFLGIGTDGGAYFAGTSGASSLNFGLGGTTRLFISSGGNVGIGTGTTTPSAQLQVRGSGATSSTTALRIENSNASASLVVNDDRQTRITSDGAALYVQGAGVSPFNQNIAEFLYAGNGNSLLITNINGEPGFSTSTNGNINFRPNGTGIVRMDLSTTLRFDNTTNNEGISLRNNASSGQAHLNFTTGSTSILFLSGSGNVGIGTSTPTSRLDVYGNIRSFGDGNHTYFRLFSGASNRDSKILFGNDAERFNVGLGASTNTFSINSSNGGTPTSINIDYTSGNVGIGTTNPQTKLDVSGSINTRSAAPTILFDRNGSYTWRLVNGDGTTFPLSTFNIANNASTAITTFLDNGNVGIGTTNPAYKLDINGSFNTITSGTNLTYNSGILYHGDGVGDYYQYISGLDYNIRNRVTGSLVFATDDITRMTLNKDGNLGIGTTSPSARLQVKGSGATSSTTALLVENDNNQGYLKVQDDGAVSIGKLTDGELIIFSGNFRSFLKFNSGKLEFQDYQTQAGALSSTGLVLTNTSDPFPINRLDVVGRTFIGPTISVASASLHILGNTSSSLSSSLLIQNINRSASLSVLDNGNVGIGTATPNARLDVSGSVIITGSFSSFTTGSSGFVSIVSGSQPSNDIAFNFRKIGETAGSRHTMIVQGSGGNDNNLYFGVNTVGSSPGAIFAVKGNGSVNINMPSPTGNYGGLAVGGWNSSYPSLLVRGIGATSSTTTLLVENSNTSASLVVLDNGNVGIGTTNPTYKLDISTTGNTDGVVQRLFGDADYGATTSYSRGAFYKWDVGVGASATNNIPYSNFGIVEGTTLRFVIGVGGNVGIGTSTPNAKLDVSGSAIITGSLTVTQGITGSLFGTSSFASTASFLNTLNQDLTFNGNLTLNGTASIGTLVVNQTVLSTGSNQLGDAANDTQTLFGSVIIPTGSFTVTGSLNANNTLFVSGSNVGIGTTSPTASLDIQKNSATAVRIGDAGSYPILFNFNTQTGDLSTFSRIRSLSSQPIILSPMGTDAVTINTSGNVGIGTTSPTSKLEVRGSGATSSTTALRIENSNATASFIVRDDSDVFIGNNSTSGILYLPRDPSFGDRVLVRLQNSNNITLLGVVSQDTLYTNMGFIVNNTTTLNGNIQGINYTGTGSVYRFVSEMNSYEGTGNLIHVSAQIRNQSNGISNIIAITSPFVTDSPGQIIRGFYYNPSISGMASVADNRAIETTSGNILFQSGSSPLFFVSQSGNVGIGTINPASRLDVQGDINIGVSGATTVSTYYNSTTRNQIIYTNNSSFEFIEGANERMRLVAGSGNLLVGTTSNLARLQVRGAGATSSTTALRIENSNASSSLVVLDNGSVGIRTATPGAALEVNGDTIFQSTGVGDGTLAMTIKNSSGTQTLAIGAAGGIIMNTSTKIKTTIGDSSITPYIELYSNSTGNTTIQSSTSYGLVLNPAGANVGIGTTNPGYKLDVSGSIRSKSGTTGTLYLGETSGGTTYVAAALIGTPSTTYNPAGRLSIQLPTHGVGTDYGLTEQMSIQVPAADSKAATMILLPFGGNVGIGITNPGYPLDVNGIIRSNTRLIIDAAGDNAIELIRSGSGSNTFSIEHDTARLYFYNRTTAAVVFSMLNNNNIGISTANPTAKLQVRGSGATSSTTTLRVENSNASASLAILDNGTSQFTGLVGINRAPTSSLDITGTTRLSGLFNTATSGSILTVIGSGSAQPIFTVQGSQGELFSITDSLSGSLFSVNDISGLPILEVFSDNTILLGDYQAPTLYTTKKIASTTAGLNVIYSFPTSSYDGVFMDYTVKSGSNARAGNFASIWSGTAANYMDNSTTDFGSTTGMVLSASISGSNIVVFASGSTAGWTFKGIIKSI